LNWRSGTLSNRAATNSVTHRKQRRALFIDAEVIGNGVRILDYW
jgi:hypothetical protein